MKYLKGKNAVLIIFLFTFSAAIFSFNILVPPVKGEAVKQSLILSDIHFDPMFGSPKDSVLKKELETSSPMQWVKYFENTPAQMTLDKSLQYKDANYAVLLSAIINMKRRLPRPAFIIIAGDFLWHNAKPADSLLKKKTIQFIAGLFKDNFPGVPVVPALGNNDTYGADYEMQDNKFLSDFADAWSPNLPKSAADSLKINGYYTVKTGNLKLIVVNSALVNTGSKHPQAVQMFSWLQKNLAASQGKNVWIISHIPPGTNGYSNAAMWNTDCTQAFVKQVVNYAPEIKFMIASHTHFNDFKVVYNKSDQPVCFMRIVPSICANHGNNPSFEIVTYNNITGKVVKEVNHYFDLATAAKNQNIEQIVWNDSLNLTTALKIDKINAPSLSKSVSDIKSDKSGQAFYSYVNFYNVGTKIDSAKTINHSNYLNYLRADSLK